MGPKAKNHKSFYPLYGKRIFDILLSSFLFVMVMPIFFIITFFLLFDSPGGPFFIQKRFGREMRPFHLIKFRSMIAASSDSKKQFDPRCSNRITRLGRIIRKTKIDELPELINVFRGDMSIIGPRPEVEKFVLANLEDFKAILKIRPGLTDFASIKYRDEGEILANQTDAEHYYLHVILPDKLHLGRCYAENISFKTDFSIIRVTLKSIMKASG